MLDPVRQLVALGRFAATRRRQELVVMSHFDDFFRPLTEPMAWRRT